VLHSESTHHRGHRGAQRLTIPVLPIHHTLDFVSQVEDVEIDQQAHRYSAQSHVGQELRLINRVDGLDGFHFHYDSVFNDEIDAISDFELLPFIDHWLSYFSCNFETAASQFLRQAGLVGAFQKAGTEQ